MKTELVTVTSLFMAFAAQCAFATEQGFSGSIGAVAIYSETQSNLNVGAEKILTSLNREGEIVTGSTLAPLGQLRYQFGQHQLFLGQSEDTFVKGLLALEVGYQYSLDENSSFSFAIAPTLAAGKTWQNPYLLDRKREETNVEGDVLRFHYENQFALLNLAYYDRTVEKDRAPSELLRRNGDGYFAHFALVVPLFDNVFIEPSLFYQQDNAQGKANAFEKLGTGITATYLVYPYTLALDTRLSGSSYQAKHPLLGKTRQDGQINVSLSFEEAEFLGYEQMSLIAQVGYEQSHSNLTFYHREEFGILIGGLYRF
ncbi:DUF2860 domain-containing protein [Vibrio vulnificus]|uniref:DUF2860 family protein n=1 Tax=Vibrio vulnificus TaxID=672 RepID=UPI00165E88B8|nr:DUF2860 family protein [Vibrio vulnificus]EGR9006558.1 DUF2860 domain-containing protein [Vibrio vulnificus]EHU9456711.1 DUF2860 family protein [Vibrio vulnificus]